MQPNHPLLRVSPPPEAVYAARHEYCQFTGGGTYGSHLTSLRSSVPPLLCLPCSLSFSLVFSSSPIADPGQHHPPVLFSPFAPPFSRFVPLCRAHSLFLPGRKERRSERKKRRHMPRREGEASGVESSRASRRTLDAILENGVDVCARRVRGKERE